uniref:Uncharacterized protein n=1 Tax=Populus trichocarpa TaxID=3694 RepID=A0A3N7HXS5_POPTR
MAKCKNQTDNLAQIIYDRENSKQLPEIASHISRH